MEGAKDPDEFIIKYGNAKFNILVDKSISLVEFKVKMLKQNLNLENTNDKIKFLNEIAKLLCTVDNKMEQEIYIEKIAKDYSISKEAIYAETNKLSFAKNQGAKILEKDKIYTKLTQKENIDEVVIKREKMIISLIINGSKETYQQIKNKINHEDFKSEYNKQILKKIYEEFENETFNANNILELFQDNDKIISILTEIMSEDYEIKENKKMIDNILKIYEKEKLIKRKNEIITKLNNNTDKLKIEDSNKLEQELQDIIIKISKVK